MALKVQPGVEVVTHPHDVEACGFGEFRLADELCQAEGLGGTP
ncbi:hypothetical protein QFZ58_001023 [Streptomyces sp. B1I3]|nr:hypothetical protein [Streptomyces sp. B1I3]